MSRFNSLMMKLLKWPLDILIGIASVPSALVLLLYRRLGSKRLKLTTAILRKIGLFPIRDHYYEPLFNDEHLARPLGEPRKLPGLLLDANAQISQIHETNFSDEMKSLRLEAASDRTFGFTMSNSVYGPGDADFLYHFLRTHKPGKIIEIGCGHSTRIACLARQQNALEGANCEHICIEPFEVPWLETLEDITVQRKKVEECEIDWSTALSDGDLLFIDSSHMIRPQGDVLEEYLNIIPSLAPGVFVHVHDIFTPRDYPARWVVDNVLFWNEQYLLEALLSNSGRYEIVAALNYLYHSRFDQLQAVCPYLSPAVEPGAFYFRVKQQAIPA